MARITVDPGMALQVDVDDFLWPWENSTPIVMVHGCARNAHFWRRWVPALSAKHRVYRVELRGFGRSDVPPVDAPFNVPGVAEDFIKVLNNFGIEKAHFVGESSGGVYVLLFALAHPERTASLVLCDTPIKDWVGPRTAATNLGEATAGAAMLKYGVGEWCRRTLPNRLDTEAATPELQEWIIKEMGKTPSHVGAPFIDSIQEKTVVGLAPLVKDLDIPILLMAGEKSRLAREQHDVAANYLRNGKVTQFPGCGYGVNVIQPEACAEAALQFWGELP